jgi:hypothetical protein
MLSVAINDYPAGERKLRGCLNDSVVWMAWFARRGWRTESLWNERATGGNIATAIARLMDDSEPGERVAIHFSGHGSQIRDSDGDEADELDECYCPWDVKTNGPLRDDELYRLFQRRGEGVRLYLIADCCHSGSLHRRPRFESTRYLQLESFGPPGRSRRAPAVVRAAGLLLAACGEGERAREIVVRGRAHGVLTRAAIQSLGGMPPGVSHRSWLRAIRKRVAGTGQTPNLVGQSQLLDEPVFGENR